MRLEPESGIRRIDLTIANLKAGHEAFRLREPRDTMYRLSTRLVEESWLKQSHLVDALSVLLLTWNSAYYRYGPIDEAALERCLTENWTMIDSIRLRHITGWEERDRELVHHLFGVLNVALAAERKDGKRTNAAVSTAKVLHLLAPKFLPLWDARIAKAYGCDYSRNPAERYLDFCAEALRQVRLLEPDLEPEMRDRILKYIDEYNYCHFTYKWI